MFAWISCKPRGGAARFLRFRGCHMREMIQEINRVFQRHGGFAVAMLDHPRTRERLAFGTPSYWVVPIFLAKRVARSRITPLLDEIDEAVDRVLGADVRVGLGTAPFGLYITRPAEQRQVLPLGKLRRCEFPPLRAYIGRSYNHGKPRDHWIDLDDPDQSTVLYGGQTGMGKSVALQSFLLTLARGTSPEQLEMHLVDPKHRSLLPLRGLPHVRSFTDEPQAMAFVVRHVFNQIRERRAGDWSRHILLVIDEMSELNYAPGAMVTLSRLIKMGREYGIHIVGATQRASAVELSTLIRSQFQVRVAGHVADPTEARLITGQSGTGAHYLAGRGDMILCKIGAKPVRIQVYMPTSVEETAGKIGEYWGGQRLSPLMLPIYEEPVDGDAVMQAHLEKARPVFAEVWDRDKGKMLHGGKSKILRAITGDDDAKLAGPAFEMVRDVVALLRAEQVEGEHVRA